mgnify:CR=1 FL=1
MHVEAGKVIVENYLEKFKELLKIDCNMIIFGDKELEEFVDSLSQEQFKNVMNFFETMPKLKHTINWKCTGCGCDDEVTLEGMGNFFAL